MMNDRGPGPTLEVPGTKQPPPGEPGIGESERFKGKDRGKSGKRLLGATSFHACGNGNRHTAKCRARR
jgi:hypothetical protein